MTATGELIAPDARYAETSSGPRPMPPARQVAVLACMDARVDVYSALGLAEVGRRPEWHSEAFADLEEDVRASRTRILESPYIPNKDSVRGFVFDVATGRLSEVA